MNHDGAPQRSPVGTIAGQVLAGGRPVPQAIVMIIEGEATYPDLAALTDDDGQFMLGAFTPGASGRSAATGDCAIVQHVVAPAVPVVGLF
jgi:hypothetical protein